MRRTPLHDCHLEAGARMVDFAGWEMPVQYTGVMEEHRAVRTAAGLFDVSHMGEIRVRGARAEAFLQRLTPNDVSKLVPGRAHYSGLLNERGTYLDDILVYRLAPDHFLVVVNASNAERDFAWVQLQAQAEEDVEVADVSADYALLALQGPRAAAILAALTKTDLGAIKYYGFAAGEVDGAAALISRTGYTGEDGFELYLGPDAAARIWRRLLEVGHSQGSQGLIPAGLGARDTLRLEAGMALYGHEIDETTTPWEAGLDWVVKLGKAGGFLGQQALEAARRKGVERKLIGFEVVGRGIARQGYPVHAPVQADGALGQSPGVVGSLGPLGIVTSGTWSPTFEKALGMAYVPVALANPGQHLGVEIRGKVAAAVVVPLPFYRRPR